jgi:hypothetical protein
MSDPDWIHDTDPTGGPLDCEEGPDVDADEATEPNNAPFADGAADPGEHDTDDFFRWLPTLALGHRRRAQLVERPSSDGADFAAYACEGRPAATPGHARIESAVNVQAGQDAKDLGRDAPTVLTGERHARRRWRSPAWAALGLAGAGAVLGAWAWRPVTTTTALWPEKGVATPPVSVVVTAAQVLEPAASAASPLAPASQASPEAVVTAADRTALLANAPSAETARKKDSRGAPKVISPSAKGRAELPAPAPTVLGKDQYFEAP